MAWTTPPGTGQVGLYEGFASVLFNTRASAGAWSNLHIAPGFVKWPGKTGGTINGSNVNGINVGVGFGPPMVGHEFPLWNGRLTVGGQGVLLDTLIQPVGQPPQLGMEVQLSGLHPTGNVSNFIAAGNGAAVIHVPGPAGVAAMGVGGLIAVLRTRPSRHRHATASSNPNSCATVGDRTVPST